MKRHGEEGALLRYDSMDTAIEPYYGGFDDTKLLGLLSREGSQTLLLDF
jgi:hypothetical protein